MMAPLAQSDCLVIREPRAPSAKAGDRCVVARFDR